MSRLNGGRYFVAAVIIVLGSTGAIGVAQAQKEVTAKDRQEAADAYDRGASAYLSDNYAEAAHWFERAYRLAPTSAALLQAVRANENADNDLRAANLALRLRDKYPNDKQAQEVAVPIVQRAQTKYVRVVTRCDKPCEIEVDGGIVGHNTFFATPNASHKVVADFPGYGRRSSNAKGTAGSTRSLAFKSPPKPKKALAKQDDGSYKEPRNRPIPLWAFLTTAGATLAVGGMALWSGLDANKGVDAYEAAAQTASSPGIGSAAQVQAQEMLDDGQKKETRTNALIGASAGLAAATVVMGIFTDFSGSKESEETAKLKPSVQVGKGSGGFSLEGRF